MQFKFIFKQNVYYIMKKNDFAAPPKKSPLNMDFFFFFLFTLTVIYFYKIMHPKFIEILLQLKFSLDYFLCYYYNSYL